MTEFIDEILVFDVSYIVWGKKVRNFFVFIDRNSIVSFPLIYIKHGQSFKFLFIWIFRYGKLYFH